MNDFSYLTTEGFYEFGYSHAFNDSQTKQETSHKVDLGLLKFSLTIPMGRYSSLNFNFGRYGISDPTWLIISNLLTVLR